ncbi:MAG: oxidoreductase [Stenotrophomonas acidaminiphila]|nr:MAG: oxidoreductase [Stenotrophomonas acidaminiphila]
MNIRASDAGRFTPAGSSLSLTRMGYGAMQLAGPGVMGPPKDPEAALAVLREAIELGVDHIDTADFYGPHITNQIIKQALHPYPEQLTIVTKIGADRGEDGSWNLDNSPQALVRAVHDNLRNLGLDRLSVVNLRVGTPYGPQEGSIEAPLETVLELQYQGLIEHVGISTVNEDQVRQARGMGKIVCVQNHYNLAHRTDDAMIDELAQAGIAYVPYFPLGGFSPLQSGVLDEVAAELNASPMQVALAWLLQRSPNILLIPGTSSVAHLRQNVAAAGLSLPEAALQRLNSIAAAQ